MNKDSNLHPDDHRTWSRAHHTALGSQLVYCSRGNKQAHPENRSARNAYRPLYEGRRVAKRLRTNLSAILLPEIHK